ncbi:helix-turn-helix domain-containing protein (plasmid) [Brevundimonas staleyi]|uniref:Helix-turn-helix domain-containing protein n=1 Tax=Brevundimonas staleyi TaxID=74326 RepID=A0ABW0FMC0_9CAUL
MKVDDQIHPIDLAVGRNIRALRIAGGTSQSRLAEKIGVSFQQIQKYETGANRVSASKLFEIASVLKVPLERLYAGLALPGRGQQDEDDNGLEALTRLMMATAGGVALARAYVRIGHGRSRRALVDLAEAIVDGDTPSAPPSLG